jgi:hypothetical protein
MLNRSGNNFGAITAKKPALSCPRGSPPRIEMDNSEWGGIG